MMSIQDFVYMPCDPAGDWHCGSRSICVKLTTGHGGMEYWALHGKYVTGTTRKARKKRPPISIKLCTWNVRGLNKLGKLQIIKKEVQNISVTGTAETHWKTNGHFTSVNGNLIISSSNEAEAACGVAVIVNKKIKEAIIGYQLVNDRILAVKFRAQPMLQHHYPVKKTYSIFITV